MCQGYRDKCVCQATIVFTYMWLTHLILSTRVFITAAITCKTQQHGESMWQKHNAQHEKNHWKTMRQSSPSGTTKDYIMYFFFFLTQQLFYFNGSSAVAQRGFRPPQSGHFVDSAVTLHASSASSTSLTKVVLAGRGPLAKWDWQSRQPLLQHFW